jgi:hypothetical protein
MGDLRADQGETAIEHYSLRNLAFASCKLCQLILDFQPYYPELD